MVKFKTRSEVEKQLPSKTKTHYTGEVYPEIFSHIKDSELRDGMPLDAAIIWLGSFRLNTNLLHAPLPLPSLWNPQGPTSATQMMATQLGRAEEMLGGIWLPDPGAHGPPYYRLGEESCSPGLTAGNTCPCDI